MVSILHDTGDSVSAGAGTASGDTVKADCTYWHEGSGMGMMGGRGWGGSRRREKDPIPVHPPAARYMC